MYAKATLFEKIMLTIGLLVSLAAALVSFPAQAATSMNPFIGAKFFVDPNSNAQQQANSWRLSRPADAVMIDKIASRPQATWFGDWNSNIQADISSRVNQISSAGALPVLVLYNIYQRDCGTLYSAGGASSPREYKNWIRSAAKGIGSAKVAVILEPDALPMLDCLSAKDQATRYALIKDAVDVLSTQPQTFVYVDAGNGNWQPASVMASRLQKVDVALARGFSLNVSNFVTNSVNATYGQTLSGLVGGKYFVVDSGRNGLGPTDPYEWCNPAGRALGTPATASTGYAHMDAFYWIKHPGESDGTCNGGPAAGTWWGDYALGLAQRAAY